MNKRLKFGLAVLYFIVFVSIFLAYLRNHDIAVLNPAGLIADKERDLMVTAILLMLIVVIPVFIMTFAIAWRYREDNKKAKYTPDWDHHSGLEITWWAIPGLIITVLAVIAWNSSHDLDPFKKIEAANKPVTVQVVALQWRWLFIYPEQKVATVNYVRFPEDTPVNFEITADAPMNSFWIPKLGGQIYAMSGMSTKLHLMADDLGSYEGVSANLSGKGFAGMKFTAQSTSKADFDKWVAKLQNSPDQLTFDKYVELAKPSENGQQQLYSLKAEGLYDNVVMKYMHVGHKMPSDTASHNHMMEAE